MNSTKVLILINLLVIFALSAFIEIAFVILGYSQNDIRHEEFRLTRPPPYAKSDYFSKEFIEESFSQPGGWFTPPGTRIVIPRDYQGRWFNVRKGLRHTVGQPEKFDRRVLLFGGSTTYNSEVPDNLTIASQLQQIFNRNSLSIQVENWGATSVHSAQQFERLKRDVTLTSKDIVVFYDGVNDVIQRVYYENADGWIVGLPSTKSPIVVRVVLKAKNYSAFFNWFYQTFLIKKFFEFGNLPEEAAKDHAKYIREANTHVRRFGANFLHFLQPNLFTKRQLNQYEQDLVGAVKLIPTNLGEAFRLTYPLMRRALGKLDFSKDFSNAFDGIRTSPYLDFCHVTEEANKVIAHMIYQNITEPTIFSGLTDITRKPKHHYHRK